MTDPYARPADWPAHPIADQLDREREERTGPFARFALEQPVTWEGMQAADVSAPPSPTSEAEALEKAGEPVTPVEEPPPVPPGRSSRPRSQR